MTMRPGEQLITPPIIEEEEPASSSKSDRISHIQVIDQLKCDFQESIENVQNNCYFDSDQEECENIPFDPEKNAAERIACQQLLKEAIESALQISISKYKEDNYDSTETLREEILNALVKAQDFLLRVADAYQKLPEEKSHHAAAAKELTDIAFIAAEFVLRKREEKVLNISSDQKLKNIETFNSARRDILRSLHTTETLLCQIEEFPYESTYYSDEIKKAIKVRYAYAKLNFENNSDNKDIETLEVGEQKAMVEKQLRSAHNGITKLFGREDSAYIRSDDKELLKKMQERIRTFATIDLATPKMLFHAKKTLEEFCNLAAMLMDINKRPELTEHDEKAFSQALQYIQQERALADIIKSLKGAFGRDPQLDQIITSGKSNYKELSEILSSLLKGIKGPETEDVANSNGFDLFA